MIQRRVSRVVSPQELNGNIVGLIFHHLIQLEQDVKTRKDRIVYLPLFSSSHQVQPNHGLKDKANLLGLARHTCTLRLTKVGFQMKTV